MVEPGEEDLDKLKLKIDPTSVTLPYIAQSRAEVSVISYRKDPWDVIDKDSWITVEPNDKRDKITITVAENIEYSQRTGKVTIGYDDGENVMLEVIQTEYGIVFPEYPEEDDDVGDLEYTLDFSENNSYILNTTGDECTFIGVCKILNWPEGANTANLRIALPTMSGSFSTSEDITTDVKINGSYNVYVDGAYATAQNFIFNINNTSGSDSINLPTVESTITQQEFNVEVSVSLGGNIDGYLKITLS